MLANIALAGRIDDLLPQTQCTRCGFAGCRPYADAIAAGDADINRCPPGGEAVLASLAALLGRRAPPLDTTRGTPAPLTVARIDESVCIGCTLCIQACPVDAIVGAQKRLHGVLSSLCSGCELCIPPCPVDCIAMEPAGRSWSAADAQAARERHRARAARIASRRDTAALGADERKRKAAVDAALERARARRAARASG
ncbi:MAG TPA: RnfABCDGE type electron transport complex subunit B [Casimicrobiaceae bacterium]|nr:RnfABCDGE type electron transport complex subunit B [Casimicrobiaceae bacterium]